MLYDEMQRRAAEIGRLNEYVRQIQNLIITMERQPELQTAVIIQYNGYSVSISKEIMGRSEVMEDISRILSAQSKKAEDRIAELQDLKVPKKEKPQEMCIFDSARGQYIGQEVIKLAVHNGMEISANDLSNVHPQGENHNELLDEAEEYLTKNCAPEGFYFGSNNQGTGDWGLWKIEADE